MNSVAMCTFSRLEGAISSADFIASIAENAQNAEIQNVNFASLASFRKRNKCDERRCNGSIIAGETAQYLNSSRTRNSR